MTDLELQHARAHKWHLDGNPVRTLDDARAFIDSAGFSLMYPLRPAVQLPTFMGAWAGADDRLPTWQHAFSDPRAKDATDLMVRLLRERAAYEANLFDENNNFLIAASVFPYFYALVGERNPRQSPKPGPRSPYSQLACDAFAVIEKAGPICKQTLRERLGGEPSLAALDRALAELWSRLRITRVDYKQLEGGYWDVLYRWAPDAVKQGTGLSIAEALSALVSKYLDCMVAAEPGEVEAFLSNIVPRSRVKEAINALLAARELSFLHVGSRSLLHVTPAKEPSSPRVAKTLPDPRKSPIATRPR